MNEKKEVLNAGVLLKRTAKGIEDHNGLLEEMKICIEKHNLDILLGPEWLFLYKDRLYPKEGKNGLLAKIAEISKGRDTLIIPGTVMWFAGMGFYNTAPVISNGQILGEYNKKEDGGSSNIAKRRQCKRKEFRPGKEDGLYKWKDYNIGIEICADAGILWHHLSFQKRPLLDFYFLPSCGHYCCKNTLPIKTGGYALTADGNKETSEGFYHDKEKGIVNIKKRSNLIKSLALGTPRIDVYELFTGGLR